MKNNFFSNSAHWMLLFTVFASAIVSSCKKSSDDPTPTSTSARVYTANVTPTTNNGTANTTGTVTNSDGNAYLRLVVTSTTNIDHVYVTTATDNGAMLPYITTSDYTDSLGNTFKAGATSVASYTSSNTKSFVLMIPVSIRTTSAAVSDVYTIWFTNGNGSFLLPTKNRVLGPVTFTLNYGANVAASFTSVSNITLGDQTANPGSLLVTSGQVSALGTAAYDDAASSADLSLSALDVNGATKTNLSGIVWLTSPNLRGAFGYTNEPSSPNTTYIATTSGIDFDAANAATLSALTISSSSTQKVLIAQDGVYQFLTASGKKGLIRVASLDANTTTGATAVVSVKVQN